MNSTSSHEKRNYLSFDEARTYTQFQGSESSSACIDQTKSKALLTNSQKSPPLLGDSMNLLTYEEAKKMVQ